MNSLLVDFSVGQRVELHPATDRWMRGDRYGTVVNIGWKYLTIRMDASRQEVRIHPGDVLDCWTPEAIKARKAAAWLRRREYRAECKRK